MARIEGTADPDSLVGGGEADRIYGYDGNDTLDGGGGDDRLYGGTGNDLIRAGAGDALIVGGAGNDTLEGNKGDQILYGGDGDDLLAMRRQGWWSTLDPISSQQGYGGTGNDVLQFMGGMNADLFGGTGTDTARYIGYSTQFDSMSMSLAGFTTSDGLSGVYDSMERLQFFADYGVQDVTGGDLDDEIYVGAGADSVQAGAGDDTVGYRYFGTHVLDGGEGTDTLVLEGVEGVAFYFVVDGDGSVDDGNLSEIRGFEHFHVFGEGRANDFVALSSGNDTAEGASGADTLYGRGGRDQIKGGGNADHLFGGAGRDTLRGGNGDDVIQGGSGNDGLSPGYGADTVYGGDGDDRLHDGDDSAVLFGGAGSDRFILAARAALADLVGDFSSGEDVVVISTGRLAGFAGAAGPLDAQDLAQGAADRETGQLVLTREAEAGETVLWWDADGTSGSDPMQALVRFAGADVAVVYSDILLA